jgi:hypothetical protein
VCQQIEQALAKRLNAVFLRTHWETENTPNFP